MGLPVVLLIVLLSHLVAVVISTEVWVVTVVSVVSQLVLTVMEYFMVKVVRRPVIGKEVFDLNDDVGYVKVARLVEYTVIPVAFATVDVELIRGSVDGLEVLLRFQDDVGYVNVVVATCMVYTVVPEALGSVDEELARGYDLDVPASDNEAEPGPAVTV